MIEKQKPKSTQSYVEPENNKCRADIESFLKDKEHSFFNDDKLEYCAKK